MEIQIDKEGSLENLEFYNKTSVVGIVEN